MTIETGSTTPTSVPAVIEEISPSIDPYLQQSIPNVTSPKSGIKESTLFIARNLTSLDVQQGAQLATRIVEEIGPDASYIDWLVKEKGVLNQSYEVDGEKSLGQAVLLTEEASFAPMGKVSVNFKRLQAAVLERQKREAQEAAAQISTLTKATSPYTKVLSDSESKVAWNKASFENRFWGIPHVPPITEDERIEADQLAVDLRDSAALILESKGKRPGFIRMAWNGSSPFFNPSDKKKLKERDTNRYTVAEETVPLESGGSVKILIGSVGKVPPRESSLIVIRVPFLVNYTRSTNRGFLVLPRGQQAELWSRPFWMGGLGPVQSDYDAFVRVATVEDINIFKSLVDHLASQQK